MWLSICQQIWKVQQWPQNRKKSVFILIPKKGNAKKCSSYHTIVLISHAGRSKYFKLNLEVHELELPDVQAGFRKGRGTGDQVANIHCIIDKAREFQKSMYFCFIDYTKAFVWITTNCGKFLKRWESQATLSVS